MFPIPSVSNNLQHSPYEEAWVKALLTASLNWVCVYSQMMHNTFQQSTLQCSVSILQNTFILCIQCVHYSNLEV